MDYREMYVEMGISKEVVDYSESVVKGLEERFKKIERGVKSIKGTCRPAKGGNFGGTSHRNKRLWT